MGIIESSNLSDAVYERIRGMILEGTLAPGSKLNKKELAENLSVSLTPINDAVSRLAGEKLLAQRGREGYFIREYDNRALADFFAVRAGLEGISLRLYIAGASETDIGSFCTFFGSFEGTVPPDRLGEYMEEDILFHRKILEAGGTPLIREINAAYGYVLKSYEHGLVRPPEETLGEHKAIIAAVQERDAAKAADLLVNHHLKSRESLLMEIGTP